MKINFRDIPLHQRSMINEKDMFVNQVEESALSYIAALLQDVLIDRQFYKFDNQYIVDNPFYALSIMYRLPPNSDNLIVSKPIKDEKANFPYSMTELANFRYVIEKFINPICNRDSTLKEGKTQWINRLISEINQRCLANNIRVSVTDDFYDFDGKKQLEVRTDSCRDFVNYLVPSENFSSDDKSFLMLNKYWENIRTKINKYDFTTEHFILTKNIKDFSCSKEYSFNTIDEWISDCLQELHNVN